MTIPLEVALSGLPSAIRVFSHTQFGFSFMVLTFDDEPTHLLRPPAGHRRLTTRTSLRRDLSSPLSSAISEISATGSRGRT